MSKKDALMEKENEIRKLERHLDETFFALNQINEKLLEEIEHLKEWKELAYEMRNRSWWAMRNKVLMKFDYMHKKDRDYREQKQI